MTGDTITVPSGTSFARLADKNSLSPFACLSTIGLQPAADQPTRAKRSQLPSVDVAELKYALRSFFQLFAWLVFAATHVQQLAKPLPPLPGQAGCSEFSDAWLETLSLVVKSKTINP